MSTQPKRKMWFDATAEQAVAVSSKWLRTRQAAAYLNLSYRTLEKLRSTGGGPAYRKVTGTVLYRIDELDQWVEAESFASTSDQARKEERHATTK